MTETSNIIKKKPLGTRRTEKSKKAVLIGYLSRRSGARLSMLAERLGWQRHTVRASITKLRQEGYEVGVRKSPKTGEPVYSITSDAAGETA